MADLINTSVTRNIRGKIGDLIIDDLALINSRLATYTAYPGGAPVLRAGNIFKSKRTEKRTVRDWPALSIFSNSRNSEWTASRTTEDKVELTIMCMLNYTETIYTDDILEDMCDAVFSVLFKNPKFTWTVIDDAVPTVYGVFDAKPNTITYGSLDQGFIRAGSINWSGRLFLTQNQSYI